MDCRPRRSETRHRARNSPQCSKVSKRAKTIKQPTLNVRSWRSWKSMALPTRSSRTPAPLSLQQNRKPLLSPPSNPQTSLHNNKPKARRQQSRPRRLQRPRYSRLPSRSPYPLRLWPLQLRSIRPKMAANYRKRLRHHRNRREKHAQSSLQG